MSAIVIHMRKLLFHLALPAVAGLLGSIAAGDMGSVYTSLQLPSFAPPQWAFRTVWPVLYILMGVASYLVAQQKEARYQRENAQLLYRIQLIINMLWPTVFFKIGEFKLAFWVLAALLALVVATSLSFYKIKKAAGILMAPYAIWLAFAAALNYSIASMN